MKKLLMGVGMASAFLLGCANQSNVQASNGDIQSIFSSKGISYAEVFQFKDGKTGCEYIIVSGNSPSITPRMQAYGLDKENRIRGCK